MLLVPSSGLVRLAGTDARELSRRERARRVAFLAQDEPGDLPFTAREIALMGRPFRAPGPPAAIRTPRRSNGTNAR